MSLALTASSVSRIRAGSVPGKRATLPEDRFESIGVSPGERFSSFSGLTNPSGNKSLRPVVDINLLPEPGKQLFQSALAEHSRLLRYPVQAGRTALVIPAHNEEKHIVGALENIRLTSAKFSRSKNRALHIVLVANGCKDKTVQNAKEWAEKNNGVAHLV